MSHVLSCPEVRAEFSPERRPAEGPRLLRALVAPLLRWQDRWRQRRDLENLSPAQLADIGLTRARVRGWTGDAA
jgi:uncharacterized protein YjiS (DUF1127 family)